MQYERDTQKRVTEEKIEIVLRDQILKTEVKRTFYKTRSF